MLKDYIYGFDKLKSEQIKFLITCMMVGKVVDHAMLILMKDNRLVSVADEVEKAMEEQLDWLENCSLATWEMLAGLIGDDTSSRELRSTCIRCAHIAVGFFHFRALRFVKKTPWSLARGDQDANLDELLNGEEPTEEIAWKIWTMLTAGLVPRGKVKQALQLLLHIPWHTLTTEQGHAMLSIIRKVRHELGENQAICRAFLSTMNRLSPTLTVAEKEKQRILKTLQDLKKKNPNMMRKEGLYFQDLMQLSNRLEAAEEVSHGPNRAKIACSRQHKAFNNVSEERKQSYEAKLPLARSQSFAKLAEARTKAVEEKHEITAKIAKEEAVDRCLQFSVARFEEKHARLIQESWNSGVYTSKKNDKQVEEMADAPPPLIEYEEEEAEEEAWYDDDEGDEFEKPAWFRNVTSRRSDFVGCAFQFTQGAEVTYYDFLFARQGQPETIFFAPLTVAPAPTLAALAFLHDEDQYAHVFHTPRGEYKPWFELVEIREGWSVSILSGVRRTGGRHAAANGTPVSLDEFIRSLPPLPPAKPRAEAKASARGLPAAYVAECPWMVAPLPQSGMFTSKSTRVDEEEEIVDVLVKKFEEPDNAEAVEERFREMEGKRDEWAAKGVGTTGGAFVLSMRKGEWTFAKTGRTFDSCRVRAARKEIVQFCKQYKLPEYSTYATLLFEEDGAIFFAKTWGQKMSYYLDIWLHQSDKDYVFTAADIAGWVEPPEFTLWVGDFTRRQQLIRVEELRGLRPT